MVPGVKLSANWSTKIPFWHSYISCSTGDYSSANRPERPSSFLPAFQTRGTKRRETSCQKSNRLFEKSDQDSRSDPFWTFCALDRESRWS